MKNLKNWKRLAKLAKSIRKLSPKIGRIAIDYVTNLYDAWDLQG